MSNAAAVEGVHRIVTPLPWRPRSVNAYLVRLDAGGWMLVDGGVDAHDAWAVLDSAMGALGGWSFLRLHVVTHMHLDHIGLAARVRDASSVPLAMGERDAIRAATAAADPDSERASRSRMLRSNGVPAELVAAIESRGGVGPSDVRFPAADILLAGTSGVLREAGEWRYVASPGHTAGHISLLRERDGLLIAGDAVIPRTSPTIGVTPQSPDPVGDYLDTLDRLESLEPTVVMGGHGESLDGMERIRELRSELIAETNRVAALLGPAPATAWQLAERRYDGRELPDMLRIQAVRETRAHLDHLVRYADAEMSAIERVDHFRRPGNQAA